MAPSETAGTTSLLPLAIACIVAATGVTACSQNVEDRRPTVDLTYASADETDDPPVLAEGARLRIRATVHGTDEGEGGVSIESVESTAPAIVEVDAVDSASFAIRGRSTGRARLSVSGETTAGHDFDTDLPVEVADVAGLELSHRCLDSPVDRRYLAGSTVVVGYELTDDEDRSLTGTGVYPVRTPTDGASVDRSFAHHALFRVELPDEPGEEPRVELESTVDDESLAIRMVADSELDSLVWLELSDVRAGGGRGGGNGADASASGSDAVGRSDAEAVDGAGSDGTAIDGGSAGDTSPPDASVRDTVADAGPSDTSPVDARPTDASRAGDADVGPIDAASGDGVVSDASGARDGDSGTPDAMGGTDVRADASDAAATDAGQGGPLCDRPLCRVRRGDPVEGELTADATHYLHPLFRRNRALVCQAAPDVEVDLDADEHCRVEWRSPVPKADRTGRALDWAGALAVRAGSPGSCEFEVRFPDTVGPLHTAFEYEIVDQ
ncbi:MAG: hypothetical protein ABEL76_01305 [Bradymonadaceae bacterium]